MFLTSVIANHCFLWVPSVTSSATFSMTRPISCKESNVDWMFEGSREMTWSDDRRADFDSATRRLRTTSLLAPTPCWVAIQKLLQVCPRSRSRSLSRLRGYWKKEGNRDLSILVRKNQSKCLFLVGWFIWCGWIKLRSLMCFEFGDILNNPPYTMLTNAEWDFSFRSQRRNSSIEKCE